MIRVLVELWPGGDSETASVLGQVAIANATPHDDPASYVAAVVNPNGELVRSHVVTDHRRDDGWTVLVSRALAQATIDNSDEVEAVSSKIVAHLDANRMASNLATIMASGALASRGTAEGEQR